MKTVLVYSYTAVNLGDDLFLKILRERYPNIHFILLSWSDNIAYSGYGNYTYLTFCNRLLRKLISLFDKNTAVKYTTKRKYQNLKTYDAALIIGGSLFIQVDSSIQQADEFKKAFLCNTKQSFIIGANFGPFYTQEYLDFYREVFRRCRSIVFRDTYSTSLFPDSHNISTEPDVVFQLKPLVLKKEANSVGISVIDLSFRDYLKHQDENYVAFLIKLTKQLLSNGKKVYLYSFCQYEGDEKTIERIAGAIEHPHLYVVKYDGDSDKFLSVYGRMEAAFASRFHAMIISLVYKQKMLPLIYSNKMTQVLEDIGFDCEALSLYNIDTENVQSAIDRLYACNYVLPDTIRKQSERMFKDFDQFASE